MQTSDEEIQKLREHILAEIDLTREMSDTEIRAIVSEKCSIYGKQKFLKLSEQEALEQYLFHSLRKLDVLQELLDDPEITEIMVNGAEHIFYEKRGQLFESDKHFTSKEKLNDVIQQMAGSNNRMVNEASPIVDTRLANGSRVNIVLQPIAIDGSAITIRKFPEQPFDDGRSDPIWSNHRGGSRVFKSACAVPGITFLFPVGQVPEKRTHISQRTRSLDSIDDDLSQTYQYILYLYRPVSFKPRWDYGIPNGVTLNRYMQDICLNTWQGRLRYYRLQKNVTADYVASKIGMNSGTSYMKKYENTCKDYYTSVKNYKAVCEAIGISYEDIADEYMLFIDSDYDKRLANAIEKSGLSSKDFAVKYNIEYTTLRHSLKRMHKLSVKSFEKYKLIFEKLNV